MGKNVGGLWTVDVQKNEAYPLDEEENQQRRTKSFETQTRKYCVHIKSRHRRDENQNLRDKSDGKKRANEQQRCRWVGYIKRCGPVHQEKQGAHRNGDLLQSNFPGEMVQGEADDCDLVVMKQIVATLSCFKIKRAILLSLQLCFLRAKIITKIQKLWHRFLPKHANYLRLLVHDRSLVWLPCQNILDIKVASII